ncbi:MAG: sulfatase-like hydrolase/transferase, partial [Rikenellaceae bacterium]
MNYIPKPLLVGMLGIGFFVSGKKNEAPKKSDKRPNILFVLVDDQSPFDLQMYNPNSNLETPNLDRLAKEGMVMDAARHMGSMNGAVSTPSRHMIMTGRTVWHLPQSAGSPSANTVDDSMLDTMSIGATFNRAGYKTMRTCKRGNSYAGANKQFSVVHEAVKRDGTEEGGSAWHAKHVLEYLDGREESEE